MSNGLNNLVAVERTGERPGGSGFTLLEVLTALAILGLVCSSVLVVIDRCMASAADSSLRVEAFQLARENLEKVLIRDALEEGIEYGTSEKYSDVTWETVIEAFSEPVSGQMWVRAVCSAEYTDSQGQNQKVELEHWIAELSEQQAGELMDDEDMERLSLEQLISTPEEAAEYAGIDAETLEQWVKNGLVTTEAGQYIKFNLDLFMESKGDPTAQDKARQVESIQELAMTLRTAQKEQEEGADETDPTKDLSSEDLQQMNVDQVKQLLNQRRK